MVLEMIFALDSLLFWFPPASLTKLAPVSANPLTHRLSASRIAQGT